jgi:hypothetical protein
VPVCPFASVVVGTGGNWIGEHNARNCIGVLCIPFSRLPAQGHGHFLSPVSRLVAVPFYPETRYEPFYQTNRFTQTL